MLDRIRKSLPGCKKGRPCFGDRTISSTDTPKGSIGPDRPSIGNYEKVSSQKKKEKILTSAI